MSPEHSLSKALRGDRTLVMAILNLTPDSFSDGARFFSTSQSSSIQGVSEVSEASLCLDSVLETAARLIEAGADILDLGGESTRPGAPFIEAELECRRVVPVVQVLRNAFPDVVISVDTRKATVAEAGLQAGVDMINDVSGLQFDEAMASVVARYQAFLVLMHSQGTPQHMQDNPQYDSVVGDITSFFETQCQKAVSAGVQPERLILDPGFGFGKTVTHNLALLEGFAAFQSLGYPLLAGVSRKSFLTLGLKDNLGNSFPAVEQRECLTAATTAMAIERGAKVVRVHDVVTQVPVIRLLDAMQRVDSC